MHYCTNIFFFRFFSLFVSLRFHTYNIYRFVLSTINKNKYSISPVHECPSKILCFYPFKCTWLSFAHCSIARNRKSIIAFLCEHEIVVVRVQVPRSLKEIAGERSAMSRLEVQQMLSNQIFGHQIALCFGEIFSNFDRVRFSIFKHVRHQERQAQIIRVRRFIG